MKKIGGEVQIEIEGETWLQVVGHETFYSVSSLGRVRSEMKKQGTRPGRIVRPHFNKGYQMVVLHGDGRHINRSVHSLVAEAFIGTRPEGMDVNHLNGIRSDPRLANLEYCTRSENQLHAKRVMGSAVGSRNGTAKLTESAVIAIRQSRAAGATLESLSLVYGVNASVLGRAARGQTWKHV